jgi:hypothetical protein
MSNLFDPPAIVRPAQDVAALLAAANAEHEAGEQAQRVSLEHYRKAGEALLRAKAAAGHGNWLKLLREQGRMSQQRASEYMRLAAGWGKLPPGGSLGLKEALQVVEAGGVVEQSPEQAEPQAEDAGQAVSTRGQKTKDERILVNCNERLAALARAMGEDGRNGYLAGIRITNFPKFYNVPYTAHIYTEGKDWILQAGFDLDYQPLEAVFDELCQEPIDDLDKRRVRWFMGAFLADVEERRASSATGGAS